MAISTEEMRARQEAAQGDDVKIGQAIQEVTDRAQLLIREEIELAKAEVTAKISQLVKGAVRRHRGRHLHRRRRCCSSCTASPGSRGTCCSPPATTSSGASSSSRASCSCSARSPASSPRARSRSGAPPTPDLAIAEAKRIQETVKSEHPERTI